MREEKDSRVVPVMDSRNDGLHACVINFLVGVDGEADHL